MPTSLHRELLRHVLAAIGLGSTLVAPAGCDGGVTDAGPPQDDASSDAAWTAIDASRAEPPAGETPIIIQPPQQPPRSDADIDAGRYCRQLVVSREYGLPSILCSAVDGGDDDGGDGGEFLDPRFFRVRSCLPAPPAGQSCGDAYGESCILNAYSCGHATFAQRVVCGPLPGPDDACCYISEGSCPPGRPFFVGGVARLAPATNEPSWAASVRPDVDTLDAATRAALADVWTKDGLAEHASVASFSRFVLQCLAVGAPVDIVQGAQQACADEIEHARIAFGLASAYAGRPIGPGRLDVAEALDESLDALDIACGVAAEGCIAELVSATLIAVAYEGARDRVVKSVLSRVAEQELAHALLAWCYVAWACRTGNARLRARLARVFDHMDEHVGFGARTSLVADADTMRAHGYLAMDERRRVAAAVLTDVVRPAARALFAVAESARAAACRSVA